MIVYNLKKILLKAPKYIKIIPTGFRFPHPLKMGSTEHLCLRVIAWAFSWYWCLEQSPPPPSPQPASLPWCQCNCLYEHDIKQISKLIWGLKMYIRKNPGFLGETGVALWQHGTQCDSGLCWHNHGGSKQEWLEERGGPGNP